MTSRLGFSKCFSRVEARLALSHVSFEPWTSEMLNHGDGI